MQFMWTMHFDIGRRDGRYINFCEVKFSRGFTLLKQSNRNVNWDNCTEMTAMSPVTKLSRVVVTANKQIDL